MDGYFLFTRLGISQPRQANDIDVLSFVDRANLQCAARSGLQVSVELVEELFLFPHNTLCFTIQQSIQVQQFLSRSTAYNALSVRAAGELCNRMAASFMALWTLFHIQPNLGFRYECDTGGAAQVSLRKHLYFNYVQLSFCSFLSQAVT